MVWSVGKAFWYWFSGIAVSILVAILFQRKLGKRPLFTVTYLAAGLLGVFVLIASSHLSMPIGLTHYLGISVVVCVASLAARSRALASIAALSFFAGLALSRQSAERLPGLSLYIPGHSLSYGIAGMVLITASVALYLTRKSQPIELEQSQEM